MQRLQDSTLAEPATAAERTAWMRYLERTRHVDPADYDDVENAAWERLLDDLAVIGKAGKEAPR